MSVGIVAAPVAVEPLDVVHAPLTVALLDALRVSLFGIRSRPLHEMLVADALTHRIDCRIARAGDELCGTVLAAPAGYWMTAPLRHWSVAFECARARVFQPHDATTVVRPMPSGDEPAPSIEYAAGRPRLTWQAPGEAWRIVIVGTAPSARGRGVAAALYRSMMRERSLVARIAADNHASLKLHRSVGWRLYPDGDAVLAVHERLPARADS